MLRSSQYKMLIIGHRGVPALEPENTIRSFKKAEELGADLVELDVRETKDGELAVIHDPILKRLFGSSKPVSLLTLSELKEVSKGREIPTLDEVLASLHIDLIVEIKVHGIEEKVLSKLKKFPHKVMISSFYPKVLKKIRALDGNIELGLAIGYGELHLLPFILSLTRKINLTSINPRNTIVSSTLVSFFRLSKKKVYVWTVNDEKEYRRMQRLGVDGVYTDNVALIKQYA